MTLDERVPRCYHEENLKTEEKTMKKFFAILLSALMLMSLLTGCSKEVTVDAAGLQHMTLEGAVTAMTKEGYTAKLIPQEHYVLPEIITVTMEDQKEQTYTYDPATGELTFTEVTGNITISGAATESIVGTWAGTVEFSEEYIKESMTVEPTMANYFTIRPFSLDLTMTFHEDGTCALEIDEESAKKAVDQMMQDIMDGMVKLLDELLKQQGLNMTTEEYLEASGVTMEDLREQMAGQMDAQDMMENFSHEANYEIRDGKLLISDDLDTAPEEEDAAPYTLADGVLTIEASEEAAEEEGSEYMFPLVLNRVG